ncbi:BlaI/MecI/CopY family transcriptional regulator [bacterium]|nr:BlaI/MecI/CopY family transcriptional regulator [bacterium]
MTEYELGSGQMKVMRILWDKQKATAQDIIDEMNREEPTKRSTVQTFLRTLVRKGLADYSVDERTFIYYPIVGEKDIAHHAFQNFVEHVFDGSMEGFVSFFVKNNYVPQEKMEKIRRMLEDKEGSEEK